MNSVESGGKGGNGDGPKGEIPPDSFTLLVVEATERDDSVERLAGQSASGRV